MAIHADVLYRTEELKKERIGRPVLAEARQSGIVIPRLIGNRLWYLGAEIIAWSEHCKQLNAPKETKEAASA